MVTTEYGFRVDFEALRSQLTERLALLLVIGCGLVIAALLPVHSFPSSGFTVPAAFAGRIVGTIR